MQKAAKNSAHSKRFPKNAKKTRNTRSSLRCAFVDERERASSSPCIVLSTLLATAIIVVIITAFDDLAGTKIHHGRRRVAAFRRRRRQCRAIFWNRIFILTIVVTSFVRYSKSKATPLGGCSNEEKESCMCYGPCVGAEPSAQEAARRAKKKVFFE
jgi:hypothetical protein